MEMMRGSGMEWEIREHVATYYIHNLSKKKCNTHTHTHTHTQHTCI